MIAHRINDSTEELKLEVLKSAAGFYIGTFDYDSDNYGPVSRVSEYFMYESSKVSYWLTLKSLILFDTTKAKKQ
ncbi:TPA: hypothetical protein OXM12_003187 [Acinetobacter baumannii]|nr:hypothetical protein [Acinetobacter baumannii]